MKYNLVNRKTNKIEHTVDLSDEVGISGARTYFIGTNRLDSKEFDELFRVRYYKMSRNPIRWWEEEKAITDEELKIL
jgi:ribonuclease I